MSRDSVARAFAQGRTANVTRDGRKYSRANFYSHGDSLYSYGYHFAVALRDSDGDVWVNPRKYSRTTSAQQRACVNALVSEGYYCTGDLSDNLFVRWTQN